MRFKKGRKVEVMNKEVPASWRVAETVSANGHGYHGVEEVSRGNIRLYRPAISSKKSWVTGDIVEVFEDNSWKIATVLKVLKGGRYLVRPHEFTHEIRAHKTRIRAPQSCCDGQWNPVGKISRTNEVEPSFSMKICQKEDDCLPVYDHTRLKKPKRASPFCSTHLKAKKVKQSEKDVSQSQRHSFEKSDNWRHASLASKGSKQDSGLAAFLLEKEWDISAYPFATDKTICCHISQFVAIWHILEQLKHDGSLACHYLKLLARLLLFQASLDFSSLCSLYFS